LKNGKVEVPIPTNVEAGKEDQMTVA